MALDDYLGSRVEINRVIMLAGEREKGREKGREEGSRERAHETARRMLAKGMDLIEIAELTELDIKEVENLNRG